MPVVDDLIEVGAMLKQSSVWRVLVLLGGMTLASACAAQPDTSAPYTEGKQYVALPAPHERDSSVGKVEVVEVFSYGCIHCAHFAPLVEKLAQELPEGVAFKMVAAPFSAAWVPYAREVGS